MRMRICRRCGVYAPLELAVCEGCSADIREFAADVEPDGRRWASVRFERTCVACHRFTPVDGLPALPPRCGRCGTAQAVDEEAWRALLRAAHAVADLFGRHPEGYEPSPFAIDQVNPFAPMARLSSGVWFARDQADAMDGWLPEGFRAFVAPGRPIAGDTIEPLDVKVDAPGTLRTRSRTGVVQLYAVDRGFVALHRQLLGIVAHEHRVNRTEPDVVLDGKRWCCPGCGESLTRADGSPFLVRCGSCGVVANVPSHVRRASQSDPRPDPFWLAFDGPSPHRRVLERDPSVGAGEQPGDLPLERMALVESTRNGRLLGLVYVATVPALFFLFAGLVSRWPTVWGWLSR